MNSVILKPKNMNRFSLCCPKKKKKMDNDNTSFEIYEGAGNYLFSICDDCLFCDVGNNDEIERYWNSSTKEAIEKFIKNYPEKNILVIEVFYQDETYLYGFLNENNIELSNEEIEKRFIKDMK